MLLSYNPVVKVTTRIQGSTGPIMHRQKAIVRR